jgi:membrane protein implicated in regulation of membrane protease activity
VTDAEDRVLLRIRTRSMGIAAVGALIALFFDWRAAVSLTFAAAVVIFSFLVLEKLTERLVPPQEKKGFRAVLPLLLVTGAGAAALGIALLRWRGFEPVAGMAGLSVVVLAIGAELLNRKKGRSA